MYEGIFDDFETIKRHCKSNGNSKFEESAVFELLENLSPQHGPKQAVQIILEMLDAQTIRDFNHLNLVRKENVDTDDSNDSIIEVKVPQKCHPIIDLTDESSVIEKPSKNGSNSNFESDIDSDSHQENYFGQSDNGFSDSDVTKTFDDYWNPRKFNNDPQLSEILSAMFEESNQSNQFESSQINSNVPEVSEMLEENNNDPNNNLDGTIFVEELTDINNANNNIERLHSVVDVADSSNSNDILKEVIDPVPGCSKDTEERINIRINNKQSLPNVLVSQPVSPVPGCSKDFDDSSNFGSYVKKYDASIISDASCIQEIVPWANLDTINSILEKHRDSPNRKQLTLWDLMSEGSKKSSTDSKQKQNNDSCSVSKKSMKMEVEEDDLDDLLDLSTNIFNQFDSVTYNESNDSIGNSELSNEIAKHNQNSSSVKSESSDVLHFNRTDGKRKLIDVSNQLAKNENHQSQLSKADTNALPKEKFNNQNFNFTPLIQPIDPTNRFLNFMNPIIKKERIETVVSGSLNESSTIEADQTKSKDTNNITIHNLLYTEEKQRQNNFNDNLSRFTANKIEEKQEKNVLLDHLLNYVDAEISTLKSEKTNLIKPAKLNISEIKSVCHKVKAVQRPSYIRPAIFTLANGKDIHTKTKNEIVYKTPEHSERKQVQNTMMPLPRSFNIIANNPDDINEHPPSKIRRVLEPLQDNFWEIPVIRSNVINAPLKVVTSTARTVGTTPEEVTSAPRTVRVAPEVVANTPGRVTVGPQFRGLPLVVASTAPKTVINNPGAMSSVPSSTSTTTETDNYDRSIYNKLRSIFPDIKSSYIKRICKSPPILVDFNNKSQALNILIDHLLQEGSNHLQPFKDDYVEPQAPIVLSVDEQYEYLLGIFPTADPTFLRKFVEENFDKRNVIEEFIQQKLATHDYPTKEQYLAKIKVTEQIKEYTTDFNVVKFLEMFPDPFKHFEDEKRVCVHQPIAMEFLKSHFNKNKVTTICRFYTMNKYNLSLTAKALTSLGQDMKSKRMSTEMPTEVIPLLQEMAFVKHKKSIISHINTKKAAEEQLFKELQDKNLLMTCQCCFNEECMPTKCAECNDNHLFCYDCIVRGTEMVLAQGEAHIKCFTDCQSEFSLATLQKVLSPTTFSALLKKRQAAEVMAAEVEGLVSCPFCHFASIPPPEDKVFKCLNPECMKETCRQCKELNHVPLRCDEVIKTEKARLLIEEKMTEALLRICYKCKRAFYKEEGCNKMTCTCGAQMCYVCNKPVTHYNHFNAQGGANSNLCPLWSDDKRVNAEAVRKVAEDYRKVILQQNPNLKIDTDALMPKLPPRSKGPHDDIPNANQLPEHIRRVIGAGP